MKTKIVYCTVSERKDIYLAQAFVSIYSARRYNPDATIILLVDQLTDTVINRYYQNLKEYITKIIIVDIPKHLTKMERSRYLKTMIREQIEGDFLYIDTDTVITGDLSDIDKTNIEIGAVLDRHSKISEHAFSEKIKNDLAVVNMSLEELHEKYFNSGVMYAKDTPIVHELFTRWHNIWDKVRQKGKAIDQPPLARANMECGYVIKEIDGAWNCQLSDNFLKYYNQAKILHYFATNSRSPYLMHDNNLYKEISLTGAIPSKIIDAIENPKTFFANKHLLVHNDDVDFMRSNIHTIFVYHRWIYKIMEFLAHIIVKKYF